jgi:hypothetical protein
VELKVSQVNLKAFNFNKLGGLINGKLVILYMLTELLVLLLNNIYSCGILVSFSGWECFVR